MVVMFPLRLLTMDNLRGFQTDLRLAALWDDVVASNWDLIFVTQGSIREDVKTLTLSAPRSFEHTTYNKGVYIISKLAGTIMWKSLWILTVISFLNPVSPSLSNL